MARPRSSISVTEYVRTCNALRNKPFSFVEPRDVAERLGCSVAAVHRADDEYRDLRFKRAERRRVPSAETLSNRAKRLRRNRMRDAWDASIVTMPGWSTTTRVRFGGDLVEGVDPAVRLTATKVWTGAKHGKWHTYYMQPDAVVVARPGLYQTLASAGLSPIDAVHAPNGVGRLDAAMPLDARIVECAKFDDGHRRAVALLEVTVAVMAGARSLRRDDGYLVVRTTPDGPVSRFRRRLKEALKDYSEQLNAAANAGHAAAVQARLDAAEGEAADAALESVIDELVHDFA